MRLFFDNPSSIIAWTFSKLINGKGGWWILANAPSGGTKIFCEYAWGLGVSFVYSCVANSYEIFIIEWTFELIHKNIFIFKIKEIYRK